MQTFTKEQLIAKLQEIRSRHWIQNTRPGNQGGVGNTLEDLLDIKENNLPIPNASEWELKTQRINKNGRPLSLTTLFHMEPSPTALKFVPAILLPKYGWRHQKAGIEYPETELSFRQTINAGSRTNRGFGILIDHVERKVAISFDKDAVNLSFHQGWLDSVEKRAGLGELNPQPYWGFDDLFRKVADKLSNCFYVQAEVKKDGQVEYYHYKYIKMLQTASTNKLIQAIANGKILIDFDARTGHNHGTKFRMRPDAIVDLYEIVEVI